MNIHVTTINNLMILEKNIYWDLFQINRTIEIYRKIDRARILRPKTAFTKKISVSLLPSYTVFSVGIKCEKSRHQQKDAKRCEKSGKDAKRAVLWKKNRLCYIELDFDRTDVIKNKC